MGATCSGLPRRCSGEKSPLQCRSHRRRGFYPWDGKIPRRRKWQPTPGFLPGKSHGERSLVGCSPGGREGSDRRRDRARTQHAPLPLAPLDWPDEAQTHPRCCLRHWLLQAAAERSSIVCKCQYLFMPPVDGHRDYFQDLAVMSKAAINIQIDVCLWACVFTSLAKEKSLGGNQLNQRVGPCLSKLPNCSHFSLPPAAWSFLVVAHLQQHFVSSAFLFSVILVDTKLYRTPLWSVFDDQWCQTPFPVVYGHLHFVFAKVSVTVFCLFGCSQAIY